MATFDIEYSNRLPSGQTSARPITGDTTAPYRALAEAGRAISEITEEKLNQRRQMAEKERSDRIYSETENGKIAISEFDAETDSVLRGVTDPDEIQKISTERLKKRADLYKSFATLPESQQSLDLYTRKTAVNQIDAIDTMRFQRQQEKGYIAFDVRYENLAKEGKFDLLADKADQAYKSGIITDKEYTNRINKIPELQHSWNVNEIRTLSQELVGPDGDKTKAYDAINQAQKEGLINAKDNKELGDSIDNFVSGRFAKDQQAKYTNSVNHYRDYIGKMQTGDLTYEDVGNSTLSNADKEEWGVYIKRQFVKPPTNSSYDGFNAASNIVFQANGLQVNEKEAYRQLMDLRYGIQRNDAGEVEKETDPKISEYQFQWALDKIQNPMEPAVLADLKTVFDDTRKNYKGSFGFNKQEQMQAQFANRYLFEWVDKRTKEGKTPTAQEMYAKARWYKSGAPVSYDIGDNEVRGGIIYTVVDFDKDGQPIFDIEKL